MLDESDCKQVPANANTAILLLSLASFLPPVNLGTLSTCSGRRSLVRLPVVLSCLCWSR